MKHNPAPSLEKETQQNHEGRREYYSVFWWEIIRPVHGWGRIAETARGVTQIGKIQKKREGESVFRTGSARNLLGQHLELRKRRGAITRRTECRGREEGGLFKTYRILYSKLNRRVAYWNEGRRGTEPGKTESLLEDYLGKRSKLLNRRITMKK